MEKTIEKEEKKQEKYKDNYEKLPKIVKKPLEKKIFEDSKDMTMVTPGEKEKDKSWFRNLIILPKGKLITYNWP